MLLSIKTLHGEHFMRLSSLCLLVGVLGGCQVRPLYSESSPAMIGSTSPVSNVGQPPQATGLKDKLASISIDETKSRVTQEVRNHLIFLFAGGVGEPASPAYSMQLGVNAKSLSLMLIQNATNDRSGQPTAGLVRMTGTYLIKRNSDGQIVAKGTRMVTANYDSPRQRFAANRANRDAVNRGARELAEAINLSVAQDLSKL